MPADLLGSNRLFGSVIYHQVAMVRGREGSPAEVDLTPILLGNVSSFGEDPDGELYVVDRGGTVYRLQRPSR